MLAARFPWGVFRRGFCDFHVFPTAVATESHGILQSRWPTKDEATACAKRMRDALRNLGISA